MNTLNISLLLIRVSTVIFFAPWVAAKFVLPESTETIFARYYHLEISGEMVSYALGGAQVLILILFLFGLFKLFSYGAVLAMHAVSTVSTIPFMYGENMQILFYAAIPTLAALIGLFLLRREDTLLSLGR